MPQMRRCLQEYGIKKFKSPRETFSVGTAYYSTMIRVIVILSLIFSTVGVTIVNCACPEMEMKQGVCKNEQNEKPGLSQTTYCCDAEYLGLKSDFQKPAEFHPVIASLIGFFLLQTVSSPSLFSYLSLPKENSIAYSRSSVEKCALLSTFLI